MIAGHFALAAAVKSKERQVPLWSLMLATAWLDIVFVPLLLAGVESIQIAPGEDAGYGASLIYADYTHSLVGALLLATLFGLIAGKFWGKRSGTVLAAVVFSHWTLDLLFHRMDMPLLPGNFGSIPRMGLGLWQTPTVAIGIELLLVIGGAYLYWQACREVGASTDRRASIHAPAALVLVGGIGILLLDITGALG